MSEIDIHKIDNSHASDARIPNQPFKIWGKMIPSLDHGKWDYEIEKLEQPSEDCFPDEPYDVAKDDAIFLGAYDNDQCIGLAVLRRDMFRYLYLDDLKVNRDYRGQGIGGELIDACMKEAEKVGMQGVYTIGQDTNLSACLFYLKQGFEIGGFNNRNYRGTPQEKSADIYFYKDL
ncbi:GNAT family N-acetyltransferase [uncultured Lactobacillus sp.]|uniref:GNAT family N-acetyltransferase n=1 Tax=uncultured Lactobacillus sp. TaxID=153152 RepID=UPI002803B66E|nr:GNAT family N-acetyltransferase [uncultured Lactobacillus sp.]